MIAERPSRPHASLLDGLVAPDLDFDLDLRAALRLLKAERA